MNQKIQGTPVLEWNMDAREHIIVNQGGTGSSKTWSLAQLFNIKLQTEPNIVISVVRKALPTLRATAMKDFFTIMKSLDWYVEDDHSKTELIYRNPKNNSEIEFFGLDDAQKVRSRKRNYLWMNEANEFIHEDFKQLAMRTSKQIFMDYNPSDEFHWIYDHVLTRDDCRFFKSTYKDNPFLEPEKIREIERYKQTDQNYWRIYGLGEKGISETSIYTHWQFCDSLPSGDEFYGLDFGFNNPTAMSKCVIKDDDLYTQERLYRTHLNTSEIIQLIKDQKIGNKPLYCDAEDPRIIEELKRAGLNAVKADKGQDSVKAGIDAIKKRKFFITKDSVNMLKEVKSYRWREKDGKALDEPVKENDHLMDATRYAVYTHLRKPKPGVFTG